MKLSIRSILFFCLYIIGLGYILQQWNMQRRRIPVLLFHRVTDLYDPYTQPLSLKQFHYIIKFFNKRYQLKSFKYLSDYDKVSVNKSCFIVFDDALKDFIMNAWPILEMERIPVTLFVPTDAVHSQKIYWSLELLSFFIFSDKDFIKLSIEGKDRFFNLKGRKKIKAVQEIHDLLLRSKTAKRDILLEKIKIKLNVRSSNSYFQMMSLDDLNILSNKGLDIQSHTKSHEYLPILNKKSMEDEIFQSKIKLKEIFGSSPIAISYPYGGYNEDVVRIAGKHYKYGFITDNELLDLRQLDNDNLGRLVLSRINVTDRSPYELYFRINGFHSFVKRLTKRNSHLKVF
jgi:peptidoglycan/xylan/chitin deacetylase (PgdA/CDA1 family)